MGLLSRVAARSAAVAAILQGALGAPASHRQRLLLNQDVGCSKLLAALRAGLVKHAWEWPWSSAQAHVTGVDKTGLLNMDLWKTRFDGNLWRLFLEEELESSDELDEIRLATRTGRPLGGENFLLHLEALTGRRFRQQKPGRKPARS